MLSTLLLLLLSQWGSSCVVETWDWGTQQSVQSYRCAGCETGIVRPADIVFVARRDRLAEVFALLRSVVRAVPPSPQFRFALLLLEFTSESRTVVASVAGGFSSDSAAISRVVEEQSEYVGVSNVTITHLENREQLGTSGIVTILSQLLSNSLGARLQFRDGAHRHIILFTKGVPQSDELHFRGYRPAKFQLTEQECFEFVRPPDIKGHSLRDLVSHGNMSRSSFVFVTHESTPNFGQTNFARSNLTQGEFVASLQAVLLLNCVEVEVVGADELDHPRELLGSDFPNWSSSSLFCDPCETGDVARNCGGRCVPGIGCVSTHKEAVKAFGDQKYGYGLTARYGHSSPFEETSLATVSLPSGDLPSSSGECPAEFLAQRWTREHLVKKQVPVKYWNPREPFLEEVVAKDEPLVIRNSIVSTWPALTSTLWYSDSAHRFSSRLGVSTICAPVCMNT